jgi:glycerol kinase
VIWASGRHRARWFLQLLDRGRRPGRQHDRIALEAATGALEVVDIAEDLHHGGMGQATPAALWRAPGRPGVRPPILGELDSVAGPHDRVVVTGGWTRSDTYRSIKREAIGPFEVPQVAEAGARGAALFGGLAAGLFDDVEDFPRPATTRV